MRVCGMEGCGKKHHGLGFCRKHYTEKYTRSEKGKAIKKKYDCSEKGKATARRYRQEKVHKYWIKQYRQSTKGKAQKKRDRGLYEERYPERKKANKIASKNIERSQCIREGCVETGERHHSDYNRPLKVISLCRKHHIELHMQLRAS